MRSEKRYENIFTNLLINKMIYSNLKYLTDLTSSKRFQAGKLKLGLTVFRPVH